MRNLILLVVVGLFVQLGSALARTGDVYHPSDVTFKGFVQIREGKEIFVDVQKAKAGKPTIVLLNGLTYSTRNWDSFVAPLVKAGYGVVRYDMEGMGQTLLKYAPVTAPISYEQQAIDLKDLLKELQIKAPYNIAGLSYGGAIAVQFGLAFPKLAKNLIMMAPYVGPLPEQDEWIRSQIWYTRRIAPWNQANDEELYDFYLRTLVYTTYPIAEPVSAENPYKLEGIFRMVQSVRKLDAKSVANGLPANTVHLVTAVKDQYIHTADHDAFWNAVPKNSKASRVDLHDCEHKIVEDIPKFSASVVMEIVDGNKALSKGKVLQGYPFQGELRGDSETIQLPKER
jgi:pimeloyl-ACP methyl ester carboxylesterase